MHLSDIPDAGLFRRPNTEKALHIQDMVFVSVLNILPGPNVVFDSDKYYLHHYLEH
jgi:hypothetical protein